MSDEWCVSLGPAKVATVAGQRVGWRARHIHSEPTDRLGRLVLFLITLRRNLFGFDLGLRYGERLAAAALTRGGLLGLGRRRLRRRTTSERASTSETSAIRRHEARLDAQGSRTERSPHQ